jgi:trimeric autotransporter adhesin
MINLNLKVLSGALLMTLGMAMAPVSSSAQSDILLRLRSGSPLGDRFRVDSAGSVLARTYIGIGIIPFTGAGDRMMWHAFKAAFRVGGVDGTQWDDGSTGFYTFASGYNVMAQGNYSFAAGYASQSQQQYGVAMGFTANSNAPSAIAIGYRTTATGDYSLALGHRASTNGFDGAIVIGDGSSTDSVLASANNQFTVRAAGGYRLFTNATKTTGMQMNAGGSSWNIISDVNRKEDFGSVDGEDILGRLRAIPISTWRYRDEVDRTTFHIGPMAQDWQRQFGFTRDNTTINMSDLDGVSLAAIQALETRTAQQSAEIARLQGQLAQTEQRLAQMEAMLRQIQEQRR